MIRKLKNNLIWLIPLLILNVISLFNMLNAKLISSLYHNIFLKQILWFFLGYLIIYIIQKVNIKYLFKYSFVFYLFSIILLILVLFIGKDINGAKCWFKIFGINFQPSEFMKLALTLFLISVALNSKRKNLKEEFILILKLVIFTIIPSILVFLEPDTGAIINYLIILLVIIISLKLNKWWYIAFTIIALLITFLFFMGFFFFQDQLINLIGTSIFYRLDRLINFATGNSYQLENALINVSTTSMFKFNYNKITLYIPEAPTDFIFAFSIGNFGIVSGILIIISYITINIYLFKETQNLKSSQAKLFICCYLSILIFPEIYNIFMNIGLLPIMGIPLPFLSYGGTSTILNYLFLGICLNIIHKKNI